MLLHIPHVLTREQVRACRARLDAADWADGRITAGSQSAQVKRNLQLPQSSPVARELSALVEQTLRQQPLFFSAALPKRFFPPLFNCYEGGMNFGNHVDNALRYLPGTTDAVRTDVSATLFLSDPDEYDGGELVVEDTYGVHSVKLPAGDIVVYPSTSLHRVEPVSRGARVASFMWIQSLVREDARRTLLFDMDMNIQRLRERHGDTEELVGLTSTYHNLLRLWAEV